MKLLDRYISIVQYMEHNKSQ